MAAWLNSVYVPKRRPAGTGAGFPEEGRLKSTQAPLSRPTLPVNLPLEFPPDSDFKDYRQKEIASKLKWK